MIDLFKSYRITLKYQNFIISTIYFRILVAYFIFKLQDNSNILQGNLYVFTG